MEISSEGVSTFSLDISSGGAERLRQTVSDKLSQLMGSYTDAVLAEYVVMLVGRGKNQAQATKDLEAFLGDKSEEFVAWLWMHLEENIEMYLCEPKTMDSVASTADALKNGVPHRVPENSVAETAQLSSGIKESRLSSKTAAEAEVNVRKKTSRNPIVWTAEDTTKVETMVVQSREAVPSTKRRRSPDSFDLRQADSIEEKQAAKRPSLVSMNASRRLLETAVRQAVTPSSSSSLLSSSSNKVLRAPRRLLESAVRQAVVVASSSAIAEGRSLKRSGESRDDPGPHMRSAVMSIEFEKPIAVEGSGDPFSHPAAAKRGRRVGPVMLMAMKAAAAAAKDVGKSRGRESSNVWDRLHTIPDETKDRNNRKETEGWIPETEEHRNDEMETRKRKRLRKEVDRARKRSGKDGSVVSEAMINDDVGRSLIGQEAYSSVDIEGSSYLDDDEAEEGEFRRGNDYDSEQCIQEEGVDQSCEKPVVVQYRVAQKVGDNTNKSSVWKVQKAAGTNDSPETNVNANTRKLPYCETLKDVVVDEHSMPNSSSKQVEDEMDDKTSNVELLKSFDTKDSEPDTERDQDALKGRIGAQGEETKQKIKVPEGGKEAQGMAKSSISGAKQSQEDVDQRTVYVTNIHFAASKESLVAHFSQCGEIARAVLIKDGATGMPKGSAYVEFALRIGADRALALNDSPFLSRILKVVRKNATLLDGATPMVLRPSMMGRPIPMSLRAPLRSGMYMRGSPYFGRRFLNAPRPYITSAGLPHPSLQWKRDSAPSTTTTTTTMPPTTVVATTRPGIRVARSFSYVRNAANASTPQTAPEDAPKEGQLDIPVKEETESEL